MFSKKKSKKLDISAPTNFQHRVHTGYDDKSNKFLGEAFKPVTTIFNYTQNM